MKKIFLMLFTIFGLASPAFAGEYFIYLDSGFQVEAMQLILNAIAMIFGNDEYVTLLRLVTLFGFFIYFVKNVVIPSADGGGGKGLQGLAKYVLGYVALLSIVFSQGATVVIKTNNLNTYYDNHSETYGIAVDNVPEVLAYTYSFLDRMEKSLTNLFEITYGTSNSYKIGYQGYGSSFRDVASVLDMKTSVIDKTIDEDVDNLMSNCIYIPFSASQDGRDEIETLRNSDDIIGYFDNLYGSGKIINGVDANDFTTEYDGGVCECGNLWTGDIKPRLIALAPQLAKTVKLDVSDMQLLSQDHNPAVPISNAEQTVLQASMVNALKNNNNLGVGIASATSAAVGKTSANFILEGVGKSEFFKDMLPFLQRFLELLLIALFPMIVVMALLPGGYEIIKNYIKTLLWVKMWGVTASVVNDFILLSAQSDIKPLVDGAGLITYYNSSILLTEAGKWAGIAGLVYAAIPMLTWKIMTGAFSGLESLTGNMAGAMARNMSTSSTAADAQMMRTKDEVSKQVGHDVSYAEAMNYKAIQAGITEGSSIGTNYNMGENRQRNLNNYNNLNPYNNLNAKEAVVPGGVGGVLAFENKMNQQKTAEELAKANNRTNDDATATGTIGGLNSQKDKFKLDNFSPENIKDVNNFDVNKEMLPKLEEKNLREQNPLGLEGSLVAGTSVSTGTDLNTLNKNMDYTGGSTSKIADIMSSANNFDLARKDGNVATTTAGANYNSGVKEGAGTNANSKIVDEFGDKNITNNEVYKQETDIWANQAKEEQQASLGGVKTNVQDAAKVEVNDKKADVLATDNDGNGKLSKSELKDRLDTNTTENQAGHGAKKANLKTEQQLAEQLINSDPLAKQGAKNVPTGNSGTKNAQFRGANNHIKKHNDIRSNSVEAKDQRFKEQAGVDASSEALTKASDTTEKVYTTTNSADNRADLIKDDVKENYNDVYKQNLKEAQEKGLHGAKAREFAALQTEKEMGNINIGANNKNLYDSRLQAENERISSQRKALGDRSQTKETLSKQKEALQHYKDSGGHDKTVLENFNRNIKANETKLQQHNQLDKESKNAKFNVQQQMVKEGRATISGGKFHYNDFSNEMTGKDNNAKVLETAKVGGTKGSGKTQILDSTGKQVTSTKDHTSDVDNVAATAQVGSGISHVGGTDAFAHLNKAGHQKAADNLATGEKYVDKAMKVVETVTPVKNGIKAVVKAAAKK